MCRCKNWGNLYYRNENKYIVNQFLLISQNKNKKAKKIVCLFSSNFTIIQTKNHLISLKRNIILFKIFFVK